jgi:hypothetical protein
MEGNVEVGKRLICHGEPFGPCHSECSEESPAGQSKLREESGPFDVAHDDKIDNQEA